ncbi:hypothetical protein [Glycomyces terrestris]|uniref:Uncharacterized protein n=1 Tax=Glycomyces terrestris TaxID=2493553 RepID=A0A426UVA1_9ACTN|nr:hypothetical protein [Glycomyces terrestris]RRR98257.1 hypothetical protein EIW28_15195 [Glycomyces terrestris]
MRRRTRGAAALAAAALALAGCSAADPGAGPEAPAGSYAVMGDWLGCEVFGDFAELQTRLGATGIDGDLQSTPIGEGIDAESAGCAALLDLAVFEDVQGTFAYSAAGDAAVRGGLAPWNDEAEAEANFADRVAQRRENAAGIAYTGETEGELGGEWDKSLYIAADTEQRYYLDAYGRKGDWVVYLSLDFLHDPGVSAYESAPEFYPDASAESMAVYPFTTESLVAWITGEHLPQIQTEILQRAESEAGQ